MAPKALIGKNISTIKVGGPFSARGERQVCLNLHGLKPSLGFEKSLGLEGNPGLLKQPEEVIPCSQGRIVFRSALWAFSLPLKHNMELYNFFTGT